MFAKLVACALPPGRVPPIYLNVDAPRAGKLPRERLHPLFDAQSHNSLAISSHSQFFPTDQVQAEEGGGGLEPPACLHCVAYNQSSSVLRRSGGFSTQHNRSITS